VPGSWFISGFERENLPLDRLGVVSEAEPRNLSFDKLRAVRESNRGSSSSSLHLDTFKQWTVNSARCIKRL